MYDKTLFHGFLNLRSVLMLRFCSYEQRQSCCWSGTAKLCTKTSDECVVLPKGPGPVYDPRARLGQAFKTAATAMLATSITTFVSFVVTASSPILNIQVRPPVHLLLSGVVTFEPETQEFCPLVLVFILVARCSEFSLPCSCCGTSCWSSPSSQHSCTSTNTFACVHAPGVAAMLNAAAQTAKRRKNGKPRIKFSHRRTQKQTKPRRVNSSLRLW